MSLPSARITSKAAPELGYVAELERLPQVLDEGLEVLSVLPRHLQRIGHINYLSAALPPMRQYRARKKLEAESQKPPEEEDDSTQFS
jgi:hypothetical protein